MKRKHDIDTNTNQDGCKAVIPEDYSRQKAAKIQEHETDSTLITCLLYTSPRPRD